MKPMRRRASRWRRVQDAAGELDLRLLRASQEIDSPVFDRTLLLASHAANRSRLWFAGSALLALFGGHPGRRAAVRSALAIGATSAVVNGPLKYVWRRRRPPADLTLRRPNLLRAPRSFSFPSGHAASAFAFAASVSAELPPLAVPAFAAATTVGYSRVHTGVHFPGDVAAGAALGLAAAAVAGRVLGADHTLSLPPAEPGPLPREVVLVTSAHSGSSGGLEQAERALQAHGLSVAERIPVEEAERLQAFVERSPRPLFVAAGGDGTVGAVADHIAGTGALLGILPLGTSNDVARSLGIPVDPAAAAATLAGGVARTIDAGRISVDGGRPRYFVHAATVGLNVHFAQLATSSSVRRRFGRMTYAVAAARALREHEPFECELHTDDGVQELRLAQLSIVNAPVFGGALDLRVPGARVDDRRLLVIAVEDEAVPRLLAGAVVTTITRRSEAGGVHALRLRNLRVHVKRPVDVALDGEIGPTLPADFEVAPDALRVITPR